MQSGLWEEGTSPEGTQQGQNVPMCRTHVSYPLAQTVSTRHLPPMPRRALLSSNWDEVTHQGGTTEVAGVGTCPAQNR